MNKFPSRANCKPFLERAAAARTDKFVAYILVTELEKLDLVLTRTDRVYLNLILSCVIESVATSPFTRTVVLPNRIENIDVVVWDT